MWTGVSGLQRLLWPGACLTGSFPLRGMESVPRLGFFLWWNSFTGALWRTSYGTMGTKRLPEPDSLCGVSCLCCVVASESPPEGECFFQSIPLAAPASSPGTHLGSIRGWCGEWPSPSCLLMLVGGQEMLSKDRLLPWVLLCCSSSIQVPN